MNVTLGLPIIRTSVDHGTAYDLAGTGKACHLSMMASIRTAVGMVKKASGKNRANGTRHKAQGVESGT